MKIKVKSKCDLNYTLKLSHRELTMIWYVLNYHTLRDKEGELGEINDRLFDRDEFKTRDEWDDEETAVWNMIDDALDSVDVY